MYDKPKVTIDLDEYNQLLKLKTEYEKITANNDKVEEVLTYRLIPGVIDESLAIVLPNGEVLSAEISRRSSRLLQSTKAEFILKYSNKII